MGFSPAPTTYGGDQPEVVERRGTQPVNHAPYVGHGVPRLGFELREHGVGRLFLRISYPTAYETRCPKHMGKESRTGREDRVPIRPG